MDSIKALRRLRIDWQETEDKPYEFSANVEGEELRLRLNDFPEEPLCTLFSQGKEVDLDDLGPRWTLPKHRGE